MELAVRVLVWSSMLLMAATFRHGPLRAAKQAAAPQNGRAITWLASNPEIQLAAAEEKDKMGSASSFRGTATEWTGPGNVVSSQAMQALFMGPEGTLSAILRQSGQTVKLESNQSIMRAPKALLELKDLQGGAEYVGVMGVGTGPEGKGPESELRVIYDTGSSDVWVASDLCVHAPCTEAPRQRFNHTRSRTFERALDSSEFVTAYSSGRLTGQAGMDDIRMGPLTVKKQSLGLIAEEYGSVFRHMPFDGIVGLGFAALSRPGTKPLMQSLVDQDLLPAPQFAFYLHREPASGGALLWGGAGTDLYKGDITWLPVADQQYWAVELLSFRVGDFVLNATGRSLGSSSSSGGESSSTGGTAHEAHKISLLVDSGTTFNTLTPDAYHAVMQAAKAGPCDAVQDSPPLVYTVLDDAGIPQDIIVGPEEYMVRSPWNADICFPGVVQVIDEPRDTPVLILGEVFMRHHYTVFHWGDGRPARTHEQNSTRSEGAYIGVADACSSKEASAVLRRTA